MQEEESLTLPISGKTVVIKGYVSGKIDAEIQSIVNQGYSIDSEIDIADNAEDSKVRSSKMKFELGNTQKANRRAMELMLISLDGDTSNVYERVMDLHAGDVDYVTEQINEITAKSKLTPKQKKS